MVDQQVCTFSLNGILFGIPVQQVQEVVRVQGVTPVPLAAADIYGLINLRGQIVTLIRLQHRLGLAADDAMPAVADNPLSLVIQSGTEAIGLLVEEIGEVVAFATDSFEPPPATLQGRMRRMLAGAYPFKDGFLLVLDAQKIGSDPGASEYKPIISRSIDNGNAPEPESSDDQIFKR